MTMILLNFSHPLTPDHLRQIEARTDRKVERVIEVHSQIDPLRANFFIFLEELSVSSKSTVRSIHSSL
jgi:hypothetical protein